MTQKKFTEVSGLPEETAIFLFEYHDDLDSSQMEELARNLSRTFCYDRVVIAGLDKFEFNDPNLPRLRTILVPETTDACAKRAWLFVHPTLDFVVAGHDYYGEVTFRNPALVAEGYIWLRDNADWSSLDFGESRYCHPIYARFL